jgi:hypothetical protein
MDRDELIAWGLELVKTSAGAVELDDSAVEWFADHFGPSADRLAAHPAVFRRFSSRLAEHLDRLGECAAVGTLVARLDRVSADVMPGALAAVGARYGTLTSLCDPPPGG